MCVLYVRSEVRTRDKEKILQGSRPRVLDLWKHCRVEWRKVIHEARIDSNFPLLSKVPSHLGGDVFDGAVRGALGFMEDQAVKAQPGTVEQCSEIGSVPVAREKVAALLV